MNNYFDLSSENVDTITIYKSNNGKTCYIAKKEDKSNFISGFVLFTGPKVRVVCDVGFSPSSKTGKYIPRLAFKKILSNEEEKTTDKEYVRIEFTKSDRGANEFWKMISFLSIFKDIVDIGNFDNQFKVIDSNIYISEFKTKQEYEKVEELKKLKINNETLKKYLSDKRSKIVKKFREMLENNKNIEEYKQDFNIVQNGYEPAWHHFLKNNDWILGLNVDVRFIKDFTDEVQVGNSNTIGSGNPKTDIMGISDYTTLIELKTASTDFFTETKSSKSRAGTWSFTNDFIEGISQCLKQKFDWDKEQKGKDLIKDSEVVNQNINRTVDPKVVFIIGNKQRELNMDNTEAENIMKRDTLERFKRNNRNVEIISYDELYERAYFIIYGEKALLLNFDNQVNDKEINIEDIPF